MQEDIEKDKNKSIDNSKKIICPKCHKEVDSIDKFCPFCGYTLKKGIKIHKNVEIILNKKTFIISAIVIIAIIIIVLWLTGIISICGDKYCVARECNSGCHDCNADKCYDNICQPQVAEKCSNTDDCICEVHEICKPERAFTDNKGCYEMICGDDYCDTKKEDKNNCCLDCGCVEGYACNIEKNECQFDPPNIVIEDYEVKNEISASTIFSNKKLIDDNENKNAFLTFTYKNTGVNIAKNVIVNIDLGYYTDDESITFGNIESLQTGTVNWYPTATNSMLSLKDDKNLIITITFTYKDEHGKEYTNTETIPVEIKGRNNWDFKYASWSQFVTPQDPVIRAAVSAAGSFSTQSQEGVNTAAEEIWDFLSGMGISYISDPNKEYIQYPAEVLNTKRGDCDDLAILYSAMLESVGVQTAVIEVPGHLFAAYFDGQYIYPIETTMLGQSFESALQQGNENYDQYEHSREVINIEQEWYKKNINPPADVGIKSVDMSFPVIDVQIAGSADWDCEESDGYSCDLWELDIVCNVNFVNSGQGEGHRCVTVSVIKEGSIVKTQNVCATIPANDNEEVRVHYSENSYSTYSFNYYCRYS